MGLNNGPRRNRKRLGMTLEDIRSIKSEILYKTTSGVRRRLILSEAEVDKECKEFYEAFVEGYDLER